MEKNQRTFGKKLYSSAPVASGTFNALFQAGPLVTASFDENTYPRIFERGEDTTFASSGNSAEDGSLKRRKLAKKKTEVNLEKSIKKGHEEDIQFLTDQTKEGGSHNLTIFGFYKLGLVLPEEWKNDRRERCRLWLLDVLGFEETLWGNNIAYVHRSTKANEFQAAAKKRPSGTSQPPAAVLDTPSSRPSSLSLKDIPSSIGTNESTRPGSNKRQLTVVTRDFPPRERSSDDSDYDSDNDSNEQATGPSTFSPNSGGRTSRSTSQSPFWGTRNRSLTSPADVNLMNSWTNLHIGDAPSQEEGRRTTRQGTRSRVNSESTQEGGSVAGKSRASSVDYTAGPYTRCPSRGGETIVEESKEDVDEEEVGEEAELAKLHPPTASTTMTITTRSASNSVNANKIDAHTNEASMDVTNEMAPQQGDIAEPAHIYPHMSTGTSPVIPLPKRKGIHPDAAQYCYAEENAAELSDASTVRDDTDDEQESYGTSVMPQTPSASQPCSSGAASSPTSMVPACSAPLGRPSFPHPPRYPHDLSDVEAVPTMLKHNDSGSKKPIFFRHLPEPQRPTRPRAATRPLSKSQTMPSHYSHVEASPGTTVPSVGFGAAGAAHPVHYHTPVAQRPSDMLEDFVWEQSEPIPEHVRLHLLDALSKMRTKPRLQRARSDPYSATGYTLSSPTGSPSEDSDDFRMVGRAGIGAISFGGRDSVGSVCSHQKALVCDHRQSLGVEGEDNSMSLCHSYSPCDLAREAVRNHLQTSSSMIGCVSSPTAAFVSYSPKHTSPGTQFSAGANSYRLSAFHHSSGLESNTLGFAEGSLESRRRKKKLFSEAKQRRMSMRPPQLRSDAAHKTHALQSIAETSHCSSFVFSPCPKGKGGSATKKRAGRRATTTCSRINTSDYLAEPSFVSHDSTTDFNLSFGHGSHNDTSTIAHGDGQPLSCLNELNFKGIVVGGVYQQCFDNAFPLVAAPSGSDKRVIDVTILEDNALLLSLYLPTEKKTKEVNLGPKWLWMRCSPTGYLAFCTAVVPYEKNICYFLPKHPDDWKSQTAAAKSRASIAAASGLSGRGRRFSIVPQHEFNPRPRLQSPSVRLHTNSLEIELDCQAMEDFEMMEDIAPGSPDAGAFGAMHMHSDDDLNLSMQQNDPDVDALDMTSLDLQETVSALSEHWCNAQLLSMVFDFLIDDAALFTTMAALQAKPVTSNRRSQRKETAQDSTILAAMLQLQACQTVNKTWALATYMVVAKRKSSLDLGAMMSFDFARFGKFAKKFQAGAYLSEGVCKNVYCILNPGSAQLEALSVMDIDDLRERDMVLAVTQEIQISLLCSSMVTLAICPNLVEVYSLFQANYNVPTQFWKDKKPGPGLHRHPHRENLSLREGSLEKGSFQYIRSEFCSGGDAEDCLRSIGGPPELDVVKSMLFQMCFSLYACREKLCLRHFDIKLLNFFVTTPDSLHTITTSPSTTTPAAIPAVTNLQIGLGQEVYNLPMLAGSLSLIKLADFGTSAVGSNGLGDAITAQQFTTLENSPPEFFLLGSAARQSYAADTFPLGLCFFHLLTGYAPYEELLKDVHCPDFLKEKLRKLWLTVDETSPYYLIDQVVSTLDQEGLDGEPEDVLLDTLYRYMVLFGLGEAFAGDEAAHSTYADSPVWKALYDALDLRGLHAKLADQELGQAPRPLSRKGKKAQDTPATQCAAIYERDVLRWSVRVGNDPIMTSFRDRLSAMGEEAEELLESMLHFDPARRCTMYDAMQHPVFASLRLSESDVATTAPEEGIVRYLHYYRSPAATSAEGRDAHLDALPIL